MSVFNFIIAPSLPRGKEHAPKAAEVARQHGMTDRALRSQITAERREGALILSSPGGGLYLPANREEVQQYISFMRSRAISTFLNIKGAQEALKKSEHDSDLYEQLELSQMLAEIENEEA